MATQQTRILTLVLLSTRCGALGAGVQGTVSSSLGSALRLRVVRRTLMGADGHARGVRLQQPKNAEISEQDNFLIDSCVCECPVQSYKEH